MRLARKTQGFTLVYVSERTGVDAGQLSKLERGQMATVSENVQKVCTFLRIPATAGDLPPTRAGHMLDELIAGLPGSEPAVANLVAAIEDLVLRAVARTGHRQD
ncbi:helix-turn-helix domain-containing protein [Pseudoxanthomonas wuyuanensis]